MNKEEFISELKKINIDITEQQLKDLEKYYQILVEENKKYNLTAITGELEVLNTNDVPDDGRRFAVVGVNHKAVLVQFQTCGQGVHKTEEVGLKAGEVVRSLAVLDVVAGEGGGERVGDGCAVVGVGQTVFCIAAVEVLRIFGILRSKRTFCILIIFNCVLHLS